MDRQRASDQTASAAGLVGSALARSGLSQAELARRAGMPRSVLNSYLRGHREPGVNALLRIAVAAGCRLDLAERRSPLDPGRAGRILVQVLELAEALPYRPSAENRYPPLADRLADAGSP